MENLYDKIGETNLKLLVDYFYELVFDNPQIKNHFAKTEKEIIKSKQYKFLTQFLGGPPLYSEEYGHPRLRARHLPHSIREEDAFAWLKCMYDAIQKLPLNEDLKNELFERFPRTAYFMVNE